MKALRSALSANLLVIALGLAFWSIPTIAQDAAPWVGETLDGSPCSNYARDHYGPFDYTDPRNHDGRLEQVERYHYTDETRTLAPGQLHVSSLSYTLRAFPNHYPALYTMIRYATEDIYAERAERDWARADREGRQNPPPECFLQRAIHFAPDDHRARILAGVFHHRKGAYEEAREHYREAVSLAPDSAEAHYNYGLLLTDMQEYDEARAHAAEAYRLGYPLDGLRNRLARAGYPLDN